MKHRLLALALSVAASPTLAALADLSDTPLVSVTSADVKPNVMFVLDDSGSMDWMFMPDDLEDRLNDVGARNWECNTVYYNPNITYVAPKNADGTRKADRSFTAACTNGYSSSPGCTNNLTSAFSHQARYGAYDASAQPAYYYVHSSQKFGASAYDGVSAITELSPLSTQCTTKVDSSRAWNEQPLTMTNSISSGGGGTWTRVVVGSASGPGGVDERQNFANWYSYYRKRLMMMKAAVGEAFDGITNRYRVGFITINPMTGSPATISASKFLKPKPFEGTNVGEQKRDWFDKLYGTSTSGSTPLRTALSRVGRFYAGKNDGINNGMIPTAADDPVQYPCQNLFTILTTDGYWNGPGGVDLNGNSMDAVTTDSDYTAKDAYNPEEKKFYTSVRPMFDGVSQLRTTVDKSNEYRIASCNVTVDRERTVQWQYQTATMNKTTTTVETRTTSNYQMRTNQIQARTSTAQQRTSQLQTRTSTLQTRTANLQKRTWQLQRRTSANSGSTWTGWSNVSSCTWDTTNPTLTQCQYVVSADWANAASCSAIAKSTGSSNGTVWGTQNPVDCQYTSFTAWSNATAACVPAAANGTNAVARECAYTAWSGWANGSACVAATQNNTNLTARECQYLAWSGWSNAAATCVPAAQDYNNGLAKQCQYSAWSSWANAASCTAAPQAGDYSTLTARECQNTNPAWTTLSGGQSCTPTSPNGSGQFVECNPNWGAWSNYVGPGACTPDTTGSNQRECRTTEVTVVDPGCVPSSGGGVTVTCNVVGSGPWTNSAGACTPSATNLCQTVVVVDWHNIASCVPVPVNASGIEVQCSVGSGTEPGNRVEYRTVTTSTAQNTSGGVAYGSPTTTTTTGSWGSMAAPEGTCLATASGMPTMPTPNPRRPVAPEPPLPVAPCTAWPCVSFGAASGGSTGSLADIAQYYYVNDLRSDFANEVKVSSANTSDVEADRATWQHMTTYTLGLGLSGTLAYNKDYKKGVGVFAQIRDGTVNWPAPAADSPSALDDLWHAAVNGRGQYFAAKDPESVASSLRTALSGLDARVASAAAAATSNLEPVTGDNFAYVAQYKTQAWYGNVEAREIALADSGSIHEGDVLATAVWSAATQLGTLVGSACDNRNIKLFRSGATDNLVDFKWNTSACDGSKNPTGSPTTTINATEQSYFGSAQLATLGQYPDMGDGSGGTANQRSLALGARLLNFIRGQRGNEVTDNSEPWDAVSTTALYRKRGDSDLDTVLGDVVNAQPLFVKRPFAQYNDSGYATFKSDNAARPSVVYVAANDGMLHAFNETGAEIWAFIPGAVLPELHKLANRDYATAHRFFVDGTPVAGDVFDGTHWRTIVVGGLNKGGKSYYALDVTDPAHPKALWEFTDANLGYTYGNPLIGKTKNGTWAVFLTSGVNNADGIGRLYVLNAVTGAVIDTISTGVGSAGTPSNLMKIAGWAASDPVRDNTVNHIYGADMLGNVWRFDFDDNIIPAGKEATKLITVKDSGGTPQPITTKPEVALVGTDMFVYVGTGRYLGATDMASTQVQSVYGIKDPLIEPASPGASVWANDRADLTQQTLVQSGTGLSAIRKVETCNTAPNGWYVNLPDSKERINIDMKIQLGALIAASNVPEPTACNVGGYSWLNYFDYRTGCGINADLLTGQRLADALAVGINIIRLPSGKTKVIATLSDAKTLTLTPPFAIGDPEGRRLTWREIAN